MTRKRKRPTRAEKQQRTRRELIAAAARVFATHGYAASSIEEIAEEAGYSHGAVYSNFAGKEDLFLAVYEEYVARRAEEITRASSELEGPFASRAKAVADQWMRQAAEDRNGFLLQLELILQASRNRRFGERLALRKSAVRLAIERHLEAHEQGKQAKLPLPPAELAAVLHALGNGLALEALHDPEAVPAELYGRFVSLLVAQLEADAYATR